VPTSEQPSSVSIRTPSEKLGAAYVIDPRSLDPVEAIAVLTSGDGLDVAAECAGMGATLSQALGSLGHRGRLVLIGEAAETTINSSRDLIDREATIVVRATTNSPTTTTASDSFGRDSSPSGW
jgi:threonine dehydrogenase-like Zn-dependent dehydrogenase